MTAELLIGASLLIVMSAFVLIGMYGENKIQNEYPPITPPDGERLEELRYLYQYHAEESAALSARIIAEINESVMIPANFFSEDGIE